MSNFVEGNVQGLPMFPVFMMPTGVSGMWYVLPQFPAGSQSMVQGYGHWQACLPQTNVQSEQQVPPVQGYGHWQASLPQTAVQSEQQVPPDQGYGHWQASLPQTAVQSEQVPPVQGYGHWQASLPQTAVQSEQVPPVQGYGHWQACLPQTAVQSEQVPPVQRGPQNFSPGYGYQEPKKGGGFGFPPPPRRNKPSRTDLTSKMRRDSPGQSDQGGSEKSGAPENFCKLCKSNKERQEFYLSHTLRDSETGIVTCPILRRLTCPVCGATGDNAHTVKYCPRQNLPLPQIPQSQLQQDSSSSEGGGNARRGKARSVSSDGRGGGRRRYYQPTRTAAGGYSVCKF